MAETIIKKKYRGIWPALVTPFDDKGNIDFGCYRELVEWHIGQGVHGLFSLCLSSEMHELTEAERFALIKTTVDQCDGRLPVAATISMGKSLAADIVLAEEMAQLGVDVVTLTPPMFCETENQLEAYFLEMARKVEVDLGIYECPLPKKRLLSVPLVERIARTGRYGLYKETSCCLSDIAAKVAAAKNTPLAVLQADVSLLVDACRAGADGSINVVAVAAPRLAGVLWERFDQGEDVCLLHELLLRAETLRKPGHPLGIKFLLQIQGLPITQAMRRNVPPLCEAEAQRIASGWNDLQESITRALSENPTVPARRDEAAEAVRAPKFQIEESRRVDTP